MDRIEIFNLISLSITFTSTIIALIADMIEEGNEYRKWKQWRIDNPDDF